MRTASHLNHRKPHWGMPWVATLILLVAAASTVRADARVVKIGIYENEPKCFTSKSGQPSGIFIDVIESIAKGEGWQLQFVHGTWSEGLDRLEKGSIDLMPDVARSSDREKLFAFHKIAVLSSWFQVYARKGSGIHSILDLDGKRVAVLERSIQQDAFGKLAADFQLTIPLVALPDYQAMFARVATGDVDAAITNRFYGLTHAKAFDLEDTAVIFHPSDLYFAAPRNASRTLLDAIDKHLSKMKADPQSVYYHSLKRWISEDVPFTLPPWILHVGLVSGVVLLTSLLGSLVLKRQVNHRTQALNHSNQLLHTFIACNQALVRSTDEIGLRDAICRTLSDTGGYRLAWIGLTGEEPEPPVQIVACAGGDAGSRSPTDAAGRLSPPVRSLIRQALETGTPHAASRPFSPPDEPAPDACHGVSTDTAILALPLVANGERIGVLCIMTAEPDGFSNPETVQLTELANDLAFGMASYRLREALQHAEEKRREAQQRYVDIVEFLPDATFVLDQDKKVIAWNHACETLTGVPKEALIGQDGYAHARPFFGEKRPTLIDLLDLPIPEVEATYKYIKRRGDRIYAELFIPEFDHGRGLHLWGVASPLYDRQGQRCGAIESMRDVSEQKAMEASLRASELKYRELVMLANSIILRCSRDGKITFLNAFGRQFFGYTEAEIIGRDIVGTIIPPLRNRAATCGT